jgi:DNA-directed RNA polymerase specialized sigma24 family protein
VSQVYSDDINIVRAYLRGDRQIEKRLFHDLKKLILKLIGHMEGKGCIFSDKENVVAEIIFQIMVADDRKVLRSYHGRSKLTTYLWPIVRNKIVDTIRKEKRSHIEIDQRDNLEAIYQNDASYSRTIETIIEEHILDQPKIEKLVKISKWMLQLNYHEIIKRVKQEFPEDISINSQRIAYILHTNRKILQKKLKKLRFKFD